MLPWMKARVGSAFGNRIGFRWLTSACLASGLFFTPARAALDITGPEARAFLGGRSGKIAYLKNQLKQVYYIDLSDSVLVERRVSSDNGCWSPMISPEGSRVVYETQAAIYIRPLQENSSTATLIYAGVGRNGQSLEPHWWVHPQTGDEYIIFCTGDIADLGWPPKSGTTYIQKINKATNAPDGPRQILLPFLMASGRSKNGMWGATSHHSTGMYKFYPDSVANAFFSAKNWLDSGGWGACNGSISPSKVAARQNRMMHLNSGITLPTGETYDNHKAIVIRTWDDPDLSHPLWVMGVPGQRCNNDSSGNVFWDHSEWSTDEDYFTAVGSTIIENWDSADVYMGRINYSGDSQIRRVLKGGGVNFYPHLWIKDGVAPARIRLQKAALDFVSLKKDSAGPSPQTDSVSNAGDGTLPDLKIGPLPAWLNVTVTGNGSNTPILVNAVDRSKVSPGDYTVRVKVSYGQLADTAVYTVRFRYTDAVLTTLRPDPVSRVLLPGDTVRFRVNAFDQTGAPISPPPAIAWAALDSLPIGSTGLVKADTGYYRISRFEAKVEALKCTTSVMISKHLLRIDAGAAADSVPAGWISDAPWAATWPRATLPLGPVDLKAKPDSAPASVYRTVRNPTGPYVFDSLPNGRYMVRLHFVSPYAGQNAPAGKAVVKLEGVKILEDYLPPARPDSGAQIDVKDLPVTVSDGNGLKVEFVGGAPLPLAGMEIHDIGGLAIELLAPKGGETYRVGDTLHVKWKTDGYINSVGIQMSPDSGKTWIPVTRRSAINAGQANWGDYPWVIPDSLDSVSLASGKCLLSVYDYFQTDRDFTDQAFTILARQSIGLGRERVACAGLKFESLPGRIAVTLPAAGAYSATLSDARGRTAATAAGKGPGILSVPTSALPRGIYRLQVSGPGIQVTRVLPLLQ